MRALLMFNYDKPSRIFLCILLTGNHMIFLVQFGINKHLLIFSKTANCTRPTGSCILLVFKKIYSCSFIPNCARNHVITSTKHFSPDSHVSFYSRVYFDYNPQEANGVEYCTRRDVMQRNIGCRSLYLDEKGYSGKRN